MIMIAVMMVMKPITDAWFLWEAHGMKCTDFSPRGQTSRPCHLTNVFSLHEARSLFSVLQLSAHSLFISSSFFPLSSQTGESLCLELSLARR